MSMSHTPDEESPWITGAVLLLCLLSTILFLSLPAESLIVDLVYQGF